MDTNINIELGNAVTIRVLKIKGFRRRKVLIQSRLANEVTRERWLAVGDSWNGTIRLTQMTL